jgi:hypothetical protein
MHRYWIVICPEDKYGPKNIGVSAFSSHQARNIVKEELARIKWSHISGEVIDNSDIIEDVDIRLLDQNHIIPNIGVVIRLGVWYPNLNYSI